MRLWDFLCRMPCDDGKAGGAVTVGEDIISPHSSSPLDEFGIMGFVFKGRCCVAGNITSNPLRSEDVMGLRAIVGENIGDSTGGCAENLDCRGGDDGFESVEIVSGTGALDSCLLSEFHPKLATGA